VDARNRILAFDTIGELSSAITVLEEIMRLQRNQAWDVYWWNVIIERYYNLISSLSLEAPRESD